MNVLPNRLVLMLSVWILVPMRIPVVAVRIAALLVILRPVLKVGRNTYIYIKKDYL